jgi:rhodanese-related sulfurtransferase
MKSIATIIDKHETETELFLIVKTGCREYKVFRRLSKIKYEELYSADNLQEVFAYWKQKVLPESF